MIDKRQFLKGAGAAVLAALAPARVSAQSNAPRLTMPPLLDATKTGRFALRAGAGQVSFLGSVASDTWGFNAPYLGPVLRVPHQGEVQAQIENALAEDISVHWHGLIIPGDVDGGPMQPIAPQGAWSPVLPIDQPPATIWYHSHIHERTAAHVQKGLSGVIHLVDGRDQERGLPTEYGVDDLTLVLQDRRADPSGRVTYAPSMHDRMMGFEGDIVLVNGQFGAQAVVPRGIVRLRLLNGSNARIFVLGMDDGRLLHLIATDSGLLDQPTSLEFLTLAPGERAEVLVDFGDGLDAALISGPSPNTGLGLAAPVMPFRVDDTLTPRITSLPTGLGGSRPDLPESGALRREFSLDMRMGMGMMMGGGLTINGASYDMNTVNFTAERGQVEHWVVNGAMMMHPFHVHGVAFQVLRENGGPPRDQNIGWKDTVLINGQAELLMRFDHPASPALPYMYHCHILEHEDGGMMGQFAVD